MNMTASKECEHTMNPLLIYSTIHKRPVYQECENWFVLDEEFSFDLHSLQKEVFSCLNRKFTTPVVFCDSCEANKIVSELGEEEAEFLQYASAVYWREVGIIFIFNFEEYLPLIEIIFHELRHVMQEDIPFFKKQFEFDKKLPYEERKTEKDAFQYAKSHLQKFMKSHQDTPFFSQ